MAGLSAAFWAGLCLGPGCEGSTSGAADFWSGAAACSALGAVGGSTTGSAAGADSATGTGSATGIGSVAAGCSAVCSGIGSTGSLCGAVADSVAAVSSARVPGSATGFSAALRFWADFGARSGGGGIMGGQGLGGRSGLGYGRSFGGGFFLGLLLRGGFGGGHRLRSGLLDRDWDWGNGVSWGRSGGRFDDGCSGSH